MKSLMRHRLENLPHRRHMAHRVGSGKQLAPVPALLRLPLDIRYLIYDFLFPDKIRYIRCFGYIYGHLYKDGVLPGILLVNKQLLSEVRGYIFYTATFIAVLGVLESRNYYAINTRLQLQEGLRKLSSLLFSVQHLTLSVSIGGHDINDASILLLHYFRDCLKGAPRPISRLSIQFTTRQRLRDSPGVWNLRAGFGRSQCLRDSCAEVLLAARYFYFENLVAIDIPEELQQGCLEACSVLQAYYNMDSKAAQHPANYFGDHETLVNSFMMRFYHIVSC